MRRFIINQRFRQLNTFYNFHRQIENVPIRNIRFYHISPRDLFINKDNGQYSVNQARKFSQSKVNEHKEVEPPKEGEG
ncbi:5483_t:CDS:2 [Diversispora eburnea]|uniref:5483_t:CDS:1 n=1 Tax=Diversispora eburnea TaxID=1213867 RepID=A0A9N9BDJ2_9GLOM|nr:5483_t:CDS:2 [Diversispora eburnea]